MAEEIKKRPKVGVDVVVRKGDMILLHERKGDNNDWVWHVPGGHLELFEEVFDCAKREVKEEIDIEVKNLKVAKILNNIYRDIGIHYVTFYVDSELESGEPKIMEPEKCKSIKWFKISEIPENLHPSFQRLVDTGYFK
jgi:8-oxo-dGTP diphosphatase